MAEAFGIGSGIVGIIGITAQLGVLATKIGRDWKDAPADFVSFRNEIESLTTVLNTTRDLVNEPDLQKAFNGIPSLLREQMSRLINSTTPSQQLLSDCEGKLGRLLDEVKVVSEKSMVAKGFRKKLNPVMPFSKGKASDKLSGWSRIQAAFSAPGVREALATLRQQCHGYNTLIAIDQLRLLASTNNHVVEIRKTQNEDKEERRHNKILSEDANILDWLTMEDYHLNQFQDFRDQGQDGTGQWLLDSDSFRAWKKGTMEDGTPAEPTLFCKGMPGAGKTMISTIVIQHLVDSEANATKPKVGLAFFYFNYKRHQTVKAMEVFRILLKQLASQCTPGLPQELKELHDTCQSGQIKVLPTFRQLIKVFRATLRYFSRTFIVLDALDECPVTDGVRNKIISTLQDLQRDEVDGRIAYSGFATAREIPEIEEGFRGCAKLQIYARDEDVRLYIEERIPHLPSFVLDDAALREEIVTTIVAAVSGMFLLAKLQLNMLLGAMSISSMRRLLRRIASGSVGYELAYESILERIQHSEENARINAIKTISWIFCSAEPTSTMLLRQALAVDFDSPVFEIDNAPTVSYIISICCGLITLDENSGILKMVHYTAQEFFERKVLTGDERFHWLKESHGMVLDICLKFRSFAPDSFPNTAFSVYGNRINWRLHSSRALSGYASHHWLYHAKKTNKESRCGWNSLRLYFSGAQNSARRISDFQESFFKYQRPWTYNAVAMKSVRDSIIAIENKNWEEGIICMSVVYGLSDLTLVLIDEMLQNGHIFSENLGMADSILWFAVMCDGDEELITELCKRGMRSSLSFYHAIYNSKDQLAQLLLDFGCVKLMPDNSAVSLQSNAKLQEQPLLKRSPCPFFLVVSLGKTDILRKMIQKGIPAVLVNAADASSGLTPLCAAVKIHRTSEILRLLLRMEGIDPNQPDRYGVTPLFHAIEANNEEVVDLLLSIDPGFLVGVSGRYGESPLMAAINGHCYRITKILLKRMVGSPYFEDSMNDPIKVQPMPCEMGVKYYVDRSLDPERTPFSLAVERADVRMVELLLDTEVVFRSINSPDSRGMTPLMYGIERGPIGRTRVVDGEPRKFCFREVLRLFLARSLRIDINTKDLNGWTPLHYAADRGDAFVIRTLLQMDGIELTPRDNEGRTPLDLTISAFYVPSTSMTRAAHDFRNMQDYREQSEDDSEEKVCPGRLRLLSLGILLRLEGRKIENALIPLAPMLHCWFGRTHKENRIHKWGVSLGSLANLLFSLQRMEYLYPNSEPCSILTSQDCYTSHECEEVSRYEGILSMWDKHRLPPPNEHRQSSSKSAIDQKADNLGGLNQQHTGTEPDICPTRQTPDPVFDESYIRLFEYYEIALGRQRTGIDSTANRNPNVVSKFES